MIIGKRLSRRALLRGAGASVALPVLDAMIPAFAASRASKAASPVRLAYIYIPQGAIMEHWTPKTAGADFELPKILKPLEPYRDNLSVLSGLMDHWGNELGDGPGDHARAAATFLTGVHAKKTSGADIQVGISADQVAAQAIGSQTRLPSLEVGLEDMRTVGNCDSGYSCAYTNSISWRGATSPMPPTNNPRLVFERLFGTEDLSLDPATRARRNLYRTSILDMVRDDTQKLMGNLGASDRRKLDEYLYAIREVETRIQNAEKDNERVIPTIEKPAGIPVTFAEYAKLMYDLLALAFQTDLTRVSTLMVGREGSIRTYAEIGIPDPHHPLSHHRNNPEWMAKLARINTYHVEMFAYFLGKLKAAKEGDGTVLDRSMLVYGSAIADSNRHTHEDLPILLIGKGDGTLKPGRHIQYAKTTPVTNLHLTLLDQMGVRPESIGDSTGKLEHLTDLS
jgi:hypothetical protein